MALHKIKDFDPDYREHFKKQNAVGYDLYTNNDKIGSVDDLLVDDEGKCRYLIVNTGMWILGKKVLLPIGRARFSHSERRVYVNNRYRTKNLGYERTHLYAVPGSTRFCASNQSQSEKCSWQDEHNI